MSKCYFFIFSFSRSGSTVLGQKLNNHSNISVINESGLFTLLGFLKWKKLSPLRQRYLINQCHKNIPDLINHIKVISREITVEDFFAKMADSNSSRIGEKTPTNIFHCDYLINTVNNSKYIFLRRHPLAIANSYFDRWYEKRYSDRFLIETVSVIKAYHRQFSRFDFKDYLHITYEDLVTNSKHTMNSISDYLGVSFEQHMLEETPRLFQNSNDEQHHQDAHKKLISQKVDRYKNTFTPKQLDELGYLLRKEIKELGYPTQILKKPNPRIIRIEKKIQSNLSTFSIKKRKTISYFKAFLSYYKFLMTYYFKLK